MTILIPFKEDISEILKFGIEQSKYLKGRFIGNTSNGNFDFVSPAGKFKGTYVVKGSQIEITFDNKPFLIPNFIIKNFLQKYIK